MSVKGKNSGELLIRADAGLSIGTGHIMRCLALAQAWQDVGGRAYFAAAELPPTVQTRLVAEGFEVVHIASPAGAEEDAAETVAIAQKRANDWIVVDGYQFGADYQNAIKAAGLKLLFLDDYGHAQRYPADVVLNQNLSARPELYSDRRQEARLLLGPRYSLLRREFSAWRGWKRDVPPLCRKVLVAMGGSDPGNLSAKVLRALSRTEIDLDVMVIVGGGNPHFADLQQGAARSGLKVELRQNVDDMATQMAGTDIAVSAAGSICWELCRLGVPSVLLDVASNQSDVARELDRRGCAIHAGGGDVAEEILGEAVVRLCAAHDLRQSLAQRGQELVDGNGAARVVSVLQGAISCRLRRAREEDARLLWKWANDPKVRAASFSTEPISWETHAAWFKKKLEAGALNGGEGCRILIAEDKQAMPIGQIRFDSRPDRGWDVDLSVEGSRRGQGLGAELIRLGVEEIRAEGAAPVHAFVRPENHASLRSFEHAGFRRTSESSENGRAAIHLVLEPDDPILLTGRTRG